MIGAWTRLAFNLCFLLSITIIHGSSLLLTRNVDMFDFGQNLFLLKALRVVFFDVTRKIFFYMSLCLIPFFKLLHERKILSYVQTFSSKHSNNNNCTDMVTFSCYCIKHKQSLFILVLVDDNSNKLRGSIVNKIKLLVVIF